MNRQSSNTQIRLAIAFTLWITFVPLTIPGVHAQSDTPTPPLNGIAAVAIRVHDLPAAVAFYEKLGFQKSFDLAANGAPPSSILKINDSQFLELYPTTAQDSIVGFMRLCFEGFDLEAISQDYFSRGLSPKPPAKDAAGNLFTALGGPLQPSGAQQIEIVQYLPDSLHSNDLGKHLNPDRVADKIIAVALAMEDPDAARDFYINELNFKPIAGDQMNLHMPGDSGQEIEIIPATIGNPAFITLRSQNLAKSGRLLHKQGIASEKNGATLTVKDPDGNILILESR